MAQIHSMPSRFAYPRLNRSGLGNLLIIWARAEIYAEQEGLQVLQPQWTQPKIGPLLRGERDLRYYVGLFKRDTFVGGWRKRWILARSERLREVDLDNRELADLPKHAVVEFAGLGDMFNPLIAKHQFLAKRLQEIAASRVLQEVAAEGNDYDIACHVRRGDIAIMNPGEEVTPWKTNKALPDSWFNNALDSITLRLKRRPRIRIFSDGTDDELQLLLDRPGCTRAAPKSALADILCLANAPTVLTTGSSSFSTWGVLLGQQPAAWYPSLLQLVHPTEPGLDIATDFDGHLKSIDADKFCEAINAHSPFAGSTAK